MVFLRKAYFAAVDGVAAARLERQTRESMSTQREALPVELGEGPVDKQKLPLPLKLFGVLRLMGGLTTLPVVALLTIVVTGAFRKGVFSEDAVTSIVITFVMVAVLVCMAVLFIVFGIRLLRNKRRYAAHAAELLIFLAVAAIVCDIMLFGIGEELIFFAVIGVLLIALTGYIDPSLSQERELQRRLRDMETREQAEEGTLGRDETGRGYITLNFFNLFWIFVVCCVLGLVIEVIYHMVVVDPGHYQDRAGMLFGPFSPIYGFGAVLMTMALNRFHDRSVILIFFVSALIGGAFEYLVSWFMEFAFGAVAWDYTGTFLSIDGRTNGMFMAMWGMLGVVWIKLLLPWMLKLVNLIPWKLRYTVTSVCAVLMIADGVMTLQSLDCWYERLSGKMPDTPIEEFYENYFGDEYMANRFQSMTINPGNAARAPKP